MFLNTTPNIANVSADGKELSLMFEENVLSDFVELPEDAAGELWYSNILCGVIRGALEMVNSSLPFFLLHPYEVTKT